MYIPADAILERRQGCCVELTRRLNPPSLYFKRLCEERSSKIFQKQHPSRKPHMSLVANYSSGSDSESDNDHQKTIKPSRSFADSLPPPKRKVDVSTGKVQIFVDLPKLDDKDLDTSSTTTAPSIKRQKTSNGSGLSSLLPAPKNKNPSIKKETQAAPSTAFIPPALARRKAEIQAAKAASAQNADKEKPKVIEKPVETVNEDQENDEESDDEPAGEITSFFPLGKFNS